MNADKLKNLALANHDKLTAQVGYVEWISMIVDVVKIKCLKHRGEGLSNTQLEEVIEWLMLIDYIIDDASNNIFKKDLKQLGNDLKEAING